MASESEERSWDTWQDHITHRKEYRMDIYLGKNVKSAVKKRAEILGVTMSLYARECVRHFILTHAEDADPRE